MSGWPRESLETFKASLVEFNAASVPPLTRQLIVSKKSTVTDRELALVAAVPNLQGRGKRRHDAVVERIENDNVDGADKCASAMIVLAQKIDDRPTSDEIRLALDAFAPAVGTAGSAGGTSADSWQQAKETIVASIRSDSDDVIGTLIDHAERESARITLTREGLNTNAQLDSSHEGKLNFSEKKYEMLVDEWRKKTARRDALQAFLSRQKVRGRILTAAVKAVERDLELLVDGISRLEALQRKEETNQIMLKAKRVVPLTVQGAISCMAKICDGDKFNAEKFFAAKTPEDLEQVKDNLDSSFSKIAFKFHRHSGRHSSRHSSSQSSESIWAGMAGRLGRGSIRLISTV